MENLQSKAKKKKVVVISTKVKSKAKNKPKVKRKKKVSSKPAGIFSTEPMAQKLVTDLEGIGEKVGQRLYDSKVFYGKTIFSSPSLTSIFK